MALFKPKSLQKLESAVEEHIKTTGMTEEQLFSFAEHDEEESEKTAYSNYSYWRSTWQSFKRNRIAVALVIVVTGILLFTFIQPFLPGQYDPNQVNNDPATGVQYRNIPPGDEFIFGTNSIGQDLWARIWAGTRNSMMIGLIVAAVEALIGIITGVLWGYVRSLDWFFTELYNILDNIPNTIILILISYIMKPGLFTLIFAMSLTRWIQMARFVRNQVMVIRDREYNLASRTLGTPAGKIITRNLLPYLVSVIMLRMALTVPEAIGSEVFITYIGLGLPTSIPSLGRLIDDGRELMMSASLRYQLIFPTVIVSIVTISFYIIGNAFSDAADPRNHV
ncbi:MAG: ABC transporter permease [Lachnospiraceae bacterium]|nr:ABC transporter permease [Lachnospiraceae bacterium]